MALDPDVVISVAAGTVTRGGRNLLDKVDWQVEQDERWVILGANGAGKTTLLNIVSARLHPSSGVVHVLGQQLGRVDVFELRTRIGLASVAVHDRVPPEERVVDVVVTAAWSVMGRYRETYESQDEGRARALLDQFGVLSYAERMYGTLSEGERKRVQIARALMTDPELLLLDEPAAGLDLGGREDLVRRLAELAQDPDSPAIVLVTHHVEEIPPGFTHALLLRDGAVVAAGPIEQTVTSDNLSKTFGLSLHVEQRDSRFTARAL